MALTPDPAGLTGSDGPAEALEAATGRQCHPVDVAGSRLALEELGLGKGPSFAHSSKSHLECPLQAGAGLGLRR